MKYKWIPLFSTALLLIVSGFVGIYYLDLLVVKGNDSYEVLRLLLYAFSSFGVGLGIYNYLQRGQTTEPDRSEQESHLLAKEVYFEIAELRSVVESIRVRMEKDDIDRQQVFNDSDRQELFRSIKESIETNLSTQFVDAIDKKYSDQAIADKERRNIASDSLDIRRRCLREINNLSLRGNVNLAIGSTISLIAGYILYSTIYDGIIPHVDSAAAISFYVPRITTVVFVEVFSFFFLKLYRSNLHEIKYYQNELTNIELKLLALQTSLAFDTGALREIVLDFSKTERNFILNKGQTTEAIETSKYLGVNDLNFTENLVRVAKSISNSTKPKPTVSPVAGERKKSKAVIKTPANT